MEIFLRYLAVTDYLPNRFPTKAYDCRILFVLEGRGELRLSDRTVALSRSSFCYYPAGFEYYPVSSREEPLRFIVINFDFSLSHSHKTSTFGPVAVERFCQELAIESHKGCGVELFQKPLVIPNAFFLKELMETVAEEYKKTTVYAREIAASYLKCALLKLAGFRGSKEHRVYQQIVDYVAEHYSEIAHNAQVGKALNYHPYYLSRILEQHTGLSLHKYVNAVRLAKAAELLASTRLSVSEVAGRVGIENPNHFYNLFSRVYGVSPSAYRKSIGAL